MPKESEALQHLAEATPLNKFVLYRLGRGLETRAYGPFLEAMISLAARRIIDGTNQARDTVHALDLMAQAFTYADQDYARQERVLTDYELKAHQENVLSGRIVRVPQEAGVSFGNGIRQVEEADKLLIYQPSARQAIISALNYETTFSPATMAGAAQTLDRQNIEKLLQETRSTMVRMPHLSVSNWAIGQTLAEIYHYVAGSNGRFGLRHIDIGSGNGATEAACLSCIVGLETDKKPELAVTTIETTPVYYDQLVEFISSDKAVAKLGLNKVFSNDPERTSSISEFGAITAIRADAIAALQTLNPKIFHSKDEIVVVTANYSWHRLTSRQKAWIINLISEAPNSIFLIGDLAQNTSIINREYFDLAANGPLNCGNQKLRYLLAGMGGYSIVDLKKEKPSLLHPGLAKMLIEESEKNDGHYWLAYKGRRAQEAVNLKPS